STTGSSAGTSTTGSSAGTSTTGSSAGTSTTGSSAATSTTGASSTTSTEVEAETFEVNIENFRFVPASITVRVGDTVRWKLESGTHTTTSSTDVWDSDSMTAGDRFSHTFDQPGTYAYFCVFHPGMQGSVVVQG
ncbi:MAG TPA: plastocyanin/azurin family copper-binding protein, partial [Acidimicrobiia bacterium]